MQTVLEFIRQDLSRVDDKRAFIESLRPLVAAPRITATLTLDAPVETILRAARDWLGRHGFQAGGREIDYDSRRLQTVFEQEYDRNAEPFDGVKRLTSEKVKLRIEADVAVLEAGQTRIAIDKPLKSLLAALSGELTAKYGPGTRSRRILQDPIRGPGEPIDRAWTGTLLDYSGCATLNDVKDLVLRRGEGKALPLGFYSFTPGGRDGKPGQGQGTLLSLGSFYSGAHMEYNGVLVVAPQNSGKTELIMRWAVAANRAGYSVLIVDVKGGLISRLKQAGLSGKVWHYTTDPAPEEETHSLNMIADVDCTNRLGRHRLSQLVDAVIRVEEREGKNQDWWVTQRLNLEALILLLKLRDHALKDKTADFTDVYEHAMDEELLIDTICDIWDELPDEAEGADGEPGMDRAFLRFVVTQLSSIIDRNEDRLPEALPAGQREERYTYHSVTYGIAMALNAFNRYGTLHPRSRGPGDFSLKDLDGSEQCMIVLAAREQDGDIAKTVLTMAIKRIEQILYDRRKAAEPNHPILLLLDETRRIRGFDAADFVTFARDAKAGCVLVYQSLMQIEDEKDRTIILENIGTQIYLRSLSGKTAEAFIELLPKRSRPNFSITETSGEGQSSSIQTGMQEIPYIGEQELYRLPAGPHPALVFIKDHHVGKPFLVDMSRDRIDAAMQRFYRGESP